jgi:hypothetical protein
MTILDREDEKRSMPRAHSGQARDDPAAFSTASHRSRASSGSGARFSLAKSMPSTVSARTQTPPHAGHCSIGKP